MSDQRSLGSARGPGGTSVGQRLRRVALAFLALAPAAGFGQESPRAQPLQVVTTLPILKEVTEAIGGALVQVESLADPRQNPHVVEPRPTLMQRARRANVYVEVGLQLEPWATRVVSGSGNAAIQIGQPGHIVSSRGITTLEVPSLLTREEGSIHPYGNPYVWLDPLNLKRMAENIAQGLIRIDAAHRGDYERGLASFSRRIDEALFGGELVESVGGAKLDRLARQGRLQEFLAERDLVAGGWLALAAPLAGVQVVSYHRTWIYFCTRFGFQVPIEIEEKPGIPPSARHRERVLEVMRERKIRTILIEGYQDRRTADWLARQSKARVLSVPIDVGPEVRVRDYFALIDLLLKQLVDAEREG